MTTRFNFYAQTLNRLSRRELLNAAWKLGAAAVLQPISSSGIFAQAVFGSYPFTLGVASGDPWPDGVVLWTRLAPDPLNGGGMPAARVEVGWEIARDQAFRMIEQKGVEIARPELGHSVHVEVNGLQPGREYWYRFHAGSEVSQVGRTKTAPPADTATDQLRFAVCGCNHYEAGYFTAFRGIADERFDFVFHSGDYIYEDRADGGRNPAVVRQHNSQEIFTVVDYRNRYALYKSDRNLIAAHVSAPFIMAWDDHEVDNDYAGTAEEHDTPPEVFLLRRAAAYQAYYENMPVRHAAFPTGPNMRMYRRLTFGTLMDMNVLDTRQYRSDQVCGGGLVTGCTAAADPARTMLGTEQERWLFEQLPTVRAKWTVIAQQVPMFARDASGANPQAQYSMDKWDGYTADRDRVFARLRETKAPNPIVLSGDVHMHYGSDLKMDFRNPRSETIGVEFTNTSITSGSDGTDVATIWDQIRGANPHVKYHSARRGYIACTVTPATMRADFKILDRVTIPDQPIRTGGSVVVEAGRPGALSS
jgi:alkaline phosphatase D